MRIFWLFSTAVLLLIAISLVFKVYTVVAKSLFDGTHRFTIVQKSNPIRIYSFAPDVNQIAVLDIATSDVPFEILSKQVKIPVDATVAEKASDYSDDSVANHLKVLFFHYNERQTQMTMIDIARLWLFGQSVDQNEIVYKKIDAAALSEENTFDKIATELFWDDTIANEKQSIQVINASGVSGAGNDFARILSNMGGTVISVTTGKKEIQKTTIQYYRQPSYTVEKIEKILKKKATVSKKRRISDIIITIGKDAVKK